MPAPGRECLLLRDSLTADRYLLLFIPLPLDCDFLYITFLPDLVRCDHVSLQTGFNLAEPVKKPLIVLEGIILKHRRLFAPFSYLLYIN